MLISKLEYIICPEGVFDAVIYDTDVRRSHVRPNNFVLSFKLNALISRADPKVEDSVDEYAKVYAFLSGYYSTIQALIDLKHAYIGKDVKVKVKHKQVTPPDGDKARTFVSAVILWETLDKSEHQYDSNLDS